MNDIGKITQQWCEDSSRPSTYAATMTSTNEVAKETPVTQERCHLVIASHQSHGRGRGENTWSDTDHNSLLASWIFILEHDVTPVLSPRAGLAVFRAMKATWPQLPLSLKAPNDIYCGSKKLAGILIESVTVGEDRRLVIGIGINVLSHPEGEAEATSLNSALGAELTHLHWLGFLERLDLELLLSVNVAGEPELTGMECESLMHVLNLSEVKTESVESVSADGSITAAGKTVHWRDL